MNTTVPSKYTDRVSDLMIFTAVIVGGAVMCGLLAGALRFTHVIKGAVL